MLKISLENKELVMEIKLTSSPERWEAFVKESLFTARIRTKMALLEPSDIELLKGHLTENTSPVIFSLFVAKYALDESDNPSSWETAVKASGYAETTAQDKIQNAMEPLRFSLKHKHPIEMAAIARKMKNTGSSSRHVLFFLKDEAPQGFDPSQDVNRLHFLRDCLPDCTKQSPCPSCRAQRLLMESGMSASQITALTQMSVEFEKQH